MQLLIPCDKNSLHSMLKLMQQQSLATNYITIYCTILPQIMAQAYISYQQLFTLATKQDRCLLVEVLNQKFFGLLILMEAGDTHPADPVDSYYMCTMKWRAESVVTFL